MEPIRINTQSEKAKPGLAKDAAPSIASSATPSQTQPTAAMPKGMIAMVAGGVGLALATIGVLVWAMSGTTKPEKRNSDQVADDQPLGRQLRRDLG